MKLLKVSFLCLFLLCANNKAETYFVVLAGGNGERLWPLSRKDKPKQFLSVDGKKSIFEVTLDRLEGVKGTKHYWAVTTHTLYEPLKKLGGDRIEHYVIEPARRNTAPAIFLTCLEIAKKDPEAFVFFLPSDQYIPDHTNFVQAIHTLLERIPENGITLFGIKPAFPATGYGYIKYDAAQEGVRPALGFYEKPCLVMAQEYLFSGDMLWNTGIFFGRVSDFIKEYKTYAPHVVVSVEEFLKGEKSYEDVPDVSIDYAVLEKSSSVNILPVNFRWSDIGSMPTFLSLKAEPQDRATITVESEGNLVQTDKKLVALVGVNNMCIVEVADVLLVANCEKAEDVKKVVSQLSKDAKYKGYL